jgi:two-component system sensor histidine kinase KdpD
VLSDADRDRLDAHLGLAESLGGTTVRLSGPSVSSAILAYARKQNVTRILIGKPTHPRLRDRLRGSLLDEIVRGSEDIDIHVIRGESQEDRRPRAPRGSGDPQPVAAYVKAVGLVGLTTGAAAAIRSLFPLPDLEVLYLLAVMLAAIRLGRGPSILAAALGVAAYDFFFVPPFLTFAVADARYLLTFGMMFGVGFVVSELTTRLKRQEEVALQRGERTGVLYALTRELATAEGPQASAAVVCRRASEVFAAQVHVLRPGADGAVEPSGSAPPGAMLDPKELGVARWCLEHGQMAGLGTDTLPGSRILAMPLRVGESILGVLALEPHGPAPPRGEQREFLDAFCRQAAFAFERNRLVDEAQTAALRARTEEVRSALLSAVSHDLRTPLAIITGTATALRDDTELDAGTRTELVESICDEAERLERLVSNLLDMTRLAAGTIALKREWVPMVEVVGSALSRLESRLGDRPIVVDLPVDLPLVSLDPVLFEQAFVNLFENAVKYTPAGSPIEVHARLEGETTRRLVIEIDDRGPGLVPGTEESIFEKFYRGAHVGVAGVGLGLPICRAILDAHGGRLDARNRPGGGASFRMVLPLTGAAPTLGPADPDPEPAGGTDD